MKRRIFLQGFCYLLAMLYSIIFSLTYLSTSTLCVMADSKKSDFNVMINLQDTNSGAVTMINKGLLVLKIADAETEMDKSSVVKQLDGLTIQQLVDTYQNPIYINDKVDKEGKIYFSVPVGIYYVTETEVIDRKIHSFIFEIKEGEEVHAEPKKINTYYGNVSVIKVSRDDKKLADAQFEIYKIVNGQKELVPIQNGKYNPSLRVSDTLKTNQLGELRVEHLPVGEYILKETKAPAGYLIREAETAFDINANQDMEVKVLNYKDGYGDFQFQKISEDGTPLAAARFLVTKKAGNSYEKVIVQQKEYELSSDQNGNFVVYDLPYGQYYLWEVKSPMGYYPLSTGIPFEITQESYQQMLTIKNKKISGEGKTPIVVPNTGDITLLIMILFGIAFVVMGNGLLKEDNK